MAYGINGTLYVGQDPYGYDENSKNRQRAFFSSYNNLWSVNDPIVIGAYWNLLNENQEPLASNAVTSGANVYGDIVNVIFDVYQISESSGATFPDDWTLVGSIRKSRDIRNISDMDRVNGGDGVSTSQGHIFTVDISEMCKDLLSYSLVPHGKGTYANTFWGGLNGGADQQQNRFEFIGTDIFSVTRNGAYRKIKVQIRCEIIDGDGIIREATLAGSVKQSNSNFAVINSAIDYDDSFPAGVRGQPSSFVHLGWGTSNKYWRSFMTRATNGNWGGTINYNGDTRVLSKDVRMDEAAEFIQWIQGTVNNYAIWNSGFDDTADPPETKYGTNNTSDLTDQVWIEITAKDADWNTVRNAELYDFTQNFRPKETINGIAGIWPRSQWRMCAQNISPVFINANCIHKDSAVKDIWENGGETYTRREIDVNGVTSDKSALFLNDEISYYTISVYNKTTTSGNGTGVSKRISEIRYFKIDRDRWLNTLGSNTGYRYAGIYYTELRSDQLTLPNPIRCKGIRWVGGGLTNHDKYFRVHWLNKCGGIDSYTIKGQKSISYNAEKDIIQRKEPDRFDLRSGAINDGVDGFQPYPSNNAPVSGNYLSDNIGTTGNYKGGLEVLNVNGTKSGRVTTLPMGTEKAEWLREILTSPNVWTEYLTQWHGNGGLWYKTNYRSLDDLNDGINTDGRTPNNMDYVPIIITSSSIDTYDEAKGLTTMTFEYTHSHALVTQRN
tara:strand:+ start:6658 stop:8826 length:2169 start_codon:yes stop_codon:yes gene_type:complete